MEQPKIELRKEREIGQVINTTFSFVGQEFKPLIKILSILVLPAILIVGIVNVYFQFRIKSIGMDPKNLSYLFSIGYWGNVMLLGIIGLVTQTLLLLTIYSYIKIYITEGSENITLKKVMDGIREWFWRIFGTNIVVAILILLGCLFLIIPGIYLAIPLSYITAIMIFENKTMGESFDKCFKLSKNNWWKNFLLILVFMLIIGSVSAVIGIPLVILGIIKAMHTVGHPDQFQQISIMYNFIIVYTAIQTVISYLSYFIIYVAYSIQYFNLVEMKERPSLLQRIDTIDQEKVNP